MPALSSLYRTAFVTGASGGLGQAFAEALLREGVRVFGTARSAARLASLAAHSSFVPVELDLSRPQDAETAYKRSCAEAGSGGIDLLINNAGYGVFAPFTDLEFSSWQAQWDALFSTSARLCHAALRDMYPRNQGCVVNVSSLAVQFPLPFMSGYNAAKAALSALSESLIFETRGSGVKVIDLRPGDYRTSFNQVMQTLATRSEPDPRTQAAWRGLERNLASAPVPERAARDLVRALRTGRSGTVCSGSLFQARLAPLLSRFASARLCRAVAARYFGAT